MGQTISLKAKDGHEFSAYRADPQGKPRGGLVVIQEIFGVNHHIRAVCDRLAGEGYAALAPADAKKNTIIQHSVTVVAVSWWCANSSPVP